ncbi:MAG: hypothetical protein IJN91_05105, partial [Alphaproteobacteria bacterium]|nr:hypothetical protein [Alphaproteobacteria bacterium]
NSFVRGYHHRSLTNFEIYYVVSVRCSCFSVMLRYFIIRTAKLMVCEPRIIKLSNITSPNLK